MTFDCILLDFDGTFTDVEAEGAPFAEAYRADVSRLLGEDVTSQWLAAEGLIRNDPDRYGWNHGRRIVAPANADPYVRCTAITQVLLDERGLYVDPDERTGILQDLYARNYQKSATVFRPEARDVLDDVLGRSVPVFVVTNSRPDTVSRKIDELAPARRETLEVMGDAKKYVVVEPAEIDSTFDAIPEEEQLEGLARPVFLRRGHYYEVLRDIWGRTGARPERTLVVGDIYELDLALPARLGTAVHLVTRDTTPEYEVRAVLSKAMGAISEDLRGVLARLD